MFDISNDTHRDTPVERQMPRNWTNRFSMRKRFIDRLQCRAEESSESSLALYLHTETVDTRTGGIRLEQHTWICGCLRRWQLVFVAAYGQQFLVVWSHRSHKHLIHINCIISNHCWNCFQSIAAMLEVVQCILVHTIFCFQSSWGRCRPHFNHLQTEHFRNYNRRKNIDVNLW